MNGMSPNHLKKPLPTRRPDQQRTTVRAECWRSEEMCLFGSTPLTIPVMQMLLILSLNVSCKHQKS